MSDTTRESFVARLRSLGMKQGDFADRVGLARSTVYNWGNANEFPSWVWVLLTAWERVQELEQKGRK